MTNTKMFIIYFMIFYLFSIKFKSFLMTLISVEMLMFSTIMSMLLYLKKINSEYLIIYLLIMMVSESVLGLCILIIMSRIHKNDSLNITEMSW